MANNQHSHKPHSPTLPVLLPLNLSLHAPLQPLDKGEQKKQLTILRPTHYLPPSSSIMPTAVISPLIKAGNLTHKTVCPPPSMNTNESICCIPEQVVDLAFRTSMLRRCRFLVLYRCYITSSHPMHTPSASFWQRWDMCKGWVFELTLDGTVKYDGPYRGLEADTEREWAKGLAEIRNLVNPRGTILANQRQLGQTQEGGGERTLAPSHTKYSNKGNDLPDSNRILPYRFALYGCGDHVSTVSTIPTATGQGTWKLLINEPEKSHKSTHVLYISLPELIGHMIASGVVPKDVPRSLKQGEWGCVGLSFQSTEWPGPEGIRSSDEAKPKEKWKEGWWYTWRPGMEVWVC